MFLASIYQSCLCVLRLLLHTHCRGLLPSRHDCSAVHDSDDDDDDDDDLSDGEAQVGDRVRSRMSSVMTIRMR